MTDTSRSLERSGRRGRRRLSPVQKYEAFVQVLTGEMTVVECADHWGVDRSTIMRAREVAKIHRHLRHTRRRAHRPRPAKRQLGRFVELAHMPERERPQKRPTARRRRRHQHPQRQHLAAPPPRWLATVSSRPPAT